MYIFNNYCSLSELAKLFYAFIITRIFYPGCQLVRRPVFIRGKVRIQFGKGFATGRNCRIEATGAKGDKQKKILFGSNCKMGEGMNIAVAERLTIGENCLMASRIFISDFDYGIYSGAEEHTPPSLAPVDRPVSSAPIVIGDNVWIGEQVCILKGVRIGNGTIIGSNSVVSKSIPDNCIAAGAPARVIRTFNFQENRWEPV